MTTPLLGRLGDGRLRRAAIIGAVAVMPTGCVLSALPAGFALFLAGRALQGAGFAINPLQITGGVPPAETGSAMSFYTSSSGPSPTRWEAH